MSDLISRSALIEEIKKRSEYYLEDWDSFRKYTGGRAEESYAHFEEDKAIIKIANNLPTVEPVRGEWIDDTGPLDSARQYKCSVCGKLPILNEFWVTVLTDFCPYCGADMRGIKND